MSRRPVEVDPGPAGERAVSDAVGFVFVFSLIIVTIGLVWIAGVDAVSGVSTGEQLQNAERTFETIERNFDDIERRQAPSRAAEINLNGGTILVNESSSIRVNVTGTGFDRTIPTGALTYQLGDQRLQYENGAVVRSTDGTGVLLTDARLECGRDVAVLSIVSLRGPERTLTGSNVVTVFAERASATLAYPPNRSAPAPTGVTVEFDSGNAGGWGDYLADRDRWTDNGDGTYSCNGVDQVFVRVTTLRITLQA